MATKALATKAQRAMVDLLIDVHVHLEQYGDPAGLDRRIDEVLDQALLESRPLEATAQQYAAIRSLLREIWSDEGTLLPVPLDSAEYQAIVEALREDLINGYLSEDVDAVDVGQAYFRWALRTRTGKRYTYSGSTIRKALALGLDICIDQEVF